MVKEEQIARFWSRCVLSWQEKHGFGHEPRMEALLLVDLLQ